MFSSGRETVRSRWRRFNPDQRDFLHRLSTEYACHDVLAPWLAVSNGGSQAFLSACLQACAELEPWDLERFGNVLDQVELQLEDYGKSGTDVRAFWTRVFNELFVEAADLENAEMMQDLLALAHSGREPKLGPNRPRPNNRGLLLACERDNYELVRLMVSYGHRLRMDDMTSDSKHGRIARGETTWRDFFEIPHPGDHVGAATEKEEDDLLYLHRLKMVSCPSYILACYMVVAEKKDLDEDAKPVCECWPKEDSRRSSKKPRWPRIRSPLRSPPGLFDMLAMEMMDDVFHHCPASSKFAPHPDCVYHLECNDPIYRCFDLARMTSQGAKHFPQYRQEITEIGDTVRALSVDILAMCESKEEVTTIMKEDSGAMKYFREHTKLMPCPRIKLAVEKNQKEFVSHIHAQHYLSQKWYGNTGWQSRLLPYKTIYVVLQGLLTPVHAIVALFMTTGRHIKIMNNNVLPRITGSESLSKRLFLKYLHFCNDNNFNLEIPMNRFFSLLSYYLLFMWAIMASVVRPLYPGTNSTDFRWYHVCLLTYSSSALLADVMQMLDLHLSFYEFYDVWRFSSVITHVTVIISISINVLTNMFLPCEEEYQNMIFFCPEEYLELRRTLSNMAIFLYCTSVVYTMLRLNFYMQMHSYIGPLIIGMTRVFNDVYTMMLEYGLVIVAFTFAFVVILTSDYYVSADYLDPDNNKTKLVEYLWNETGHLYDPDKHDSNLADSFMVIIITLFWSILDPGPYVESAFLEYSSVAQMRYFTFTVGSALFQIITAVVMLNLLIATMNASIQRVEDKREMYWKYTRAGMWLEYFDDQHMLPPPFTLLNAFLWLVHSACKMCQKLGWWFEQQEDLESGSSRGRRGRSRSRSVSSAGCRVNAVGAERRRQHSRVMVKLVEKVLKKRTKKAEESSRIRVLVQEVEEMLKRLKRQEDGY